MQVLPAIKRRCEGYPLGTTKPITMVINHWTNLWDDPWSIQFHQPLKSHPSCSTKSYCCTCTPRRRGTGAGRSSQVPSNPVMVRGASATWWYTTTAPYGTIAAVHGMHQNVTGCFFYQKNCEALHADPGNLKVMTVSLDFPLGFWFNIYLDIITLR